MAGRVARAIPRGHRVLCVLGTVPLRAATPPLPRATPPHLSLAYSSWEPSTFCEGASQLQLQRKPSHLARRWSSAALSCPAGSVGRGAEEHTNDQRMTFLASSQPTHTNSIICYPCSSAQANCCGCQISPWFHRFLSCASAARSVTRSSIVRRQASSTLCLAAFVPRAPPLKPSAELGLGFCRAILTSEFVPVASNQSYLTLDRRYAFETSPLTVPSREAAATEPHGVETAARRLSSAVAWKTETSDDGASSKVTPFVTMLAVLGT